MPINCRFELENFTSTHNYILKIQKFINILHIKKVQTQKSINILKKFINILNISKHGSVSESFISTIEEKNTFNQEKKISSKLQSFCNEYIR
jgi:hypothetical protein